MREAQCQEWYYADNTRDNTRNVDVSVSSIVTCQHLERLHGTTVGSKERSSNAPRLRSSSRGAGRAQRPQRRETVLACCLLPIDSACVNNSSRFSRGVRFLCVVPHQLPLFLSPNRAGWCLQQANRARQSLLARQEPATTRSATLWQFSLRSLLRHVCQWTTQDRVNAALTMCNIPLSKPPKKITKGGRLRGSVTTLNGVWSQQLGSQESSPVGPTDVSGVSGLWVSCCPVVARDTQSFLRLF
jgi:hypothetical protein